MNVDQLKKATSHRRTDPSSKTTSVTGWHCSFCKKTFKYETRFMEHFCAPREKMDKLKSVLGQSAYAFYADWMRAKKHTVPNIDTFSNSRYFNSFYRFAEHVVKLDIAHPDVFLSEMTARELSPTIWTRDACYALYLKKLENGTDPLVLVQNSVEFLIRMSEAAEVPLNQIFSLLSSNEIGALIRKHELTPWLLFAAETFKKRLLELDVTDRSELLKVISISYWTDKFESHKKLMDDIRALTKDIGL